MISDQILALYPTTSSMYILHVEHFLRCFLNQSLPLFLDLSECKMGAHLEHRPQRFPLIDSVDQQMSTYYGHTVPQSYQFNSPVNAEHYMPSHVSVSLPPSTSSQQIPSSPQQHSLTLALPEPPRPPYQG